MRRFTIQSNAAALMVVALAGCGSGGQSSSERVLPGQFVRPVSNETSAAAQVGSSTAPSAGASAGPTAAGAGASGAAPAPRAMTAEAAREGVGRVRAEPGSPRTDAPARPAGELVLVDAKIGDVNNRAVYASGFLEPMEADLRAKAQELLGANAPNALQQWRQYAAEQIADALNRFIADEVFRAEGMASLKPDEKVGLRAYMERMRGDIVRAARGSEELAEERVAAMTGGQSLDEYLRRREQREIINFQLKRQIESKVQVPWRDIRLKYEQDYDKYNPTPTAYMRVIMAPGRDAERVAAIGESLSKGTPFDQVAASDRNAYRAKEAGLHAVPVEGGIASVEVFDPQVKGAAAVNEAARGLREGAYVGPIDFDGTQTWVYLERIEQTTRSLYDAQLAIENELFESRRKREIDRYIGKLQERASLTDTRDMMERLMQYAEERCYTPIAAGAKGP